MVKLLQTACFQGDIPWFERLMEYGVPIDASTIRQHRLGRFYACALHAAAAGGQSRVIQLLLDCGAPPKDEVLSTCAGWVREAHSWSRIARKQTALAVAIDETRQWAMAKERGFNPKSMLSLRVSKIWETCHLLMEAGSLPEDLVQLLELSAKHGQVSLVKRLLQMGYRLSQVCETRSFETIQLLVQHGSKFYAYQAQKHAIERAGCGLLNHFFGAWGIQVPDSEIRRVAVGIIRSGKLDVLLSFNTADMVLGVDTDKTVKGETLLQIACRTGSKAAIDFLLKRGADLYLTETDNNAFTTLLTRLRTQT